MENGTITFNRWVVALLTLTCFAAAAYIWNRDPDEIFWWGGFIRAGLVLGVLWFCLPARNRPAAWANFSPGSAALVAGVLMLTIIRPRLGLPLLAIFVLYRIVVTRWHRWHRR